VIALIARSTSFVANLVARRNGTETDPLAAGCLAADMVDVLEQRLSA
jgi:hypothetical protein